MGAQHTATPWEYERSLDPDDLPRPWIGRLNGGAAGSSRYSAIGCGLTADEALANAAFIVRACNAHDELLDLIHRLAVMVNSSQITGETAEAVAALGECDTLHAKIAGRFHPVCPICSGDCGAANPPMTFCPMRGES